MKSSRQSCPLCGCGTATIIGQLTGAQLRKLWQVIGVQLSEIAWGPLTVDVVVKLYECAACGFQFFDPALAGTEVFYRELEYAGYYSNCRPEFFRTLAFARRHGLKRVLDVGCGSGAFLDRAKQSELETCGLELNAAAAAKAQAKGHMILSELHGNLTLTKTHGGFDIITLFQVLEHVSSPVGLMLDAAKLLKPGGFVSVAVPNAAGVCRWSPWDPHQWPPHHISRWHLQDFAQLAARSNLRMLKSGGDILAGASIQDIWSLHNRTAPLVGDRSYPGGSLLPKVISQAYRKLGLKFFFPRWDHSIHAYFQCP
jgi:SAM-dependent methyltransferase